MSVQLEGWVWINLETGWLQGRLSLKPDIEKEAQYPERNHAPGNEAHGTTRFGKNKDGNDARQGTWINQGPNAFIKRHELGNNNGDQCSHGRITQGAPNLVRQRYLVPEHQVYATCQEAA